MKFYGKSEAAANQILELFRAGNLPAALAPIFIHRRDALPCRAWSWNNQLLTALANTSDARGFRQWLDAGRAVRAGAKAFYILGPVTAKRTESDPDTGETRERLAVVGFKSIPVFRLEDTDVVDAERWASTTRDTAALERWIDTLPLVDVARSWGLSVQTFNGRTGGAEGWYAPGAKAIALGVTNVGTWAHELVHAADDRTGARPTDNRTSAEIVAALGAAVLLEALGMHDAVDLGGAWRYIDSYAHADGVSPLTYCERMLRRVCTAVTLLLDTAAELATAAAPDQSTAAA